MFYFLSESQRKTVSVSPGCTKTGGMKSALVELVF